MEGWNEMREKKNREHDTVGEEMRMKGWNDTTERKNEERGKEYHV